MAGYHGVRLHGEANPGAGPDAGAAQRLPELSSPRAEASRWSAHVCQPFQNTCSYVIFFIIFMDWVLLLLSTL